MSASSATASSVAVPLLFKAKHHEGEGRSIREIWRALVAACTRLRLVFLILIITGFWMVQHQIYATKPEYVLRMAGEGASPSWYANVNPAVVVLTVSLVTHLMRRRTALTSMTVGMFIMPVSGRVEVRDDRGVGSGQGERPLHLVRLPRDRARVCCLAHRLRPDDEAHRRPARRGRRGRLSDLWRCSGLVLDRCAFRTYEPTSARVSCCSTRPRILAKQGLAAAVISHVLIGL